MAKGSEIRDAETLVDEEAERAAIEKFKEEQKGEKPPTTVVIARWFFRAGVQYARSAAGLIGAVEADSKAEPTE